MNKFDGLIKTDLQLELVTKIIGFTRSSCSQLNEWVIANPNMVISIPQMVIAIPF